MKILRVLRLLRLELRLEPCSNHSSVRPCIRTCPIRSTSAVVTAVTIIFFSKGKTPTSPATPSPAIPTRIVPVSIPPSAPAIAVEVIAVTKAPLSARPIVILILFVVISLKVVSAVAVLLRRVC